MGPRRKTLESIDMASKDATDLPTEEPSTRITRTKRKSIILKDPPVAPRRSPRKRRQSEAMKPVPVSPGSEDDSDANDVVPATAKSAEEATVMDMKMEVTASPDDLNEPITIEGTKKRGRPRKKKLQPELKREELEQDDETSQDQPQQEQEAEENGAHSQKHDDELIPTTADFTQMEPDTPLSTPLNTNIPLSQPTLPTPTSYHPISTTPPPPPTTTDDPTETTTPTHLNSTPTAPSAPDLDMDTFDFLFSAFDLDAQQQQQQPVGNTFGTSAPVTLPVLNWGSDEPLGVGVGSGGMGGSGGEGAGAYGGRDPLEAIFGQEDEWTEFSSGDLYTDLNTLAHPATTTTTTPGLPQFTQLPTQTFTPHNQPSSIINPSHLPTTHFHLDPTIWPNDQPQSYQPFTHTQNGHSLPTQQTWESWPTDLMSTDESAQWFQSTGLGTDAFADILRSADGGGMMSASQIHREVFDSQQQQHQEGWNGGVNNLSGFGHADARGGGGGGMPDGY